MARTQGHGNPNWSRDETVLDLDFYFQLGGRIPSGNDERVQELSRLLRRFPYHAEASRKESFRNADGVAFKLQNLRQVATGKGLGNVSETDRQVWHEFGAHPDKVRELASLIRTGITYSEKLESASREDVEFAEGRVITELHSRRERNSKMRARLLSSRRRSASLYCEMCGTPPISNNSAIQDAQFEAHHVVPLSTTEARVTRLRKWHYFARIVIDFFIEQSPLRGVGLASRKESRSAACSLGREDPRRLSHAPSILKDTGA